jgi:hypothetical protein
MQRIQKFSIWRRNDTLPDRCIAVQTSESAPRGRTLPGSMLPVLTPQAVITIGRKAP